MNSTEIMKALSEPFSATEVEWRLQYSNDTSGLAVPYIDSRAIQKRLDDVVGGFNWQNSFTMWHNNAQLCGIAIYCEERREWVTKCDGASNSDIEAVKGGLSDAFKRAAVQWGVGRYLYGMEGVWVDVEKKGKTTIIKKSEQSKLDAAYERAVSALIRGQRAAAPNVACGAEGGQTKGDKKTKVDSMKPAVPSAAETPNKPPIGAEDKVLPFPTQNPELFTVKSVKSSTNASGTSLNLEMTAPDGKVVKAYLRGENPQITAGVRLAGVKLVEKTGSYGPYNIVEAFEVAA